MEGRKVSEIKNWLKLLEDEDIVTHLGFTEIEFLIEGAYLSRLPYNYSEKDIKRLKTLRKKVKEATLRLYELKKRIEQETNLKFEEELILNYRSNFKRVYFTAIPFAFVEKFKYFDFDDLITKKSYGFVTKIGLSMYSNLKEFKFYLIGFRRYDVFIDLDLRLIKTLRYSKEKDVLKFFRKIAERTPEIYKELSEKLSKLNIKIEIEAVGLLKTPCSRECSDWFYQIEIGDKRIGISPEYHFFQDGKCKGKISKEEWNRILNDTIKDTLICRT